MCRQSRGGAVSQGMPATPRSRVRQEQILPWSPQWGPDTANTYGLLDSKAVRGYVSEVLSFPVCTDLLQWP